MHSTAHAFGGFAPILVGDSLSAQILDALPVAVYATDADGALTYFNQAAADLWGCEPALGEAYWCGSFKLYWPDGTLLPHDECPMAIALKTQRPVRGVEAIAERPDGTRIPFVPYPTPLFDASGALIGAVNMLLDVRERKQSEHTAQHLDQRANEQAALYRFTEKLVRAQSLEDIYDSALEAILHAVRCERASILLFDHAGVMRFVRWHNLSEAYRQAVEGHSPWTPDLSAPTPICVDDISAADIDEPLKRTIAAEGIGALAFIPLLARGRLIGKFMIYHDRPHVFAAAEMDLAVTIARQLGFSIERVHAEQASMHLAAIVESSDDAIISKDLNGTIVSWNEGAEHLFGYTAGEIVGKPVLTLIPADLQHEEPGILARVRGGERIDHYETVRQRKDGTLIDISLTVSPVRDSHDRVIGASKIARDITERKRAAEQRDLLVAELNHRVKNTLATVVAISHQSFAKGRSPEEARRTFEQRVRALAQTHSRLAEANWSGVSLERLLANETSPYRDDRGNVRVSGPEIQLNPKSAVSLGMAFHELTTNAAKYGALSSKDGSLGVTWSVTTDNELRIRWQEFGGPAVQLPERSGFGRLLLERALRSDLDAEVQLEFAPAGLLCVISFPLVRSSENIAPATQ